MSKRTTMRITGGYYRGRRVRCPPGVIRPAMDSMRESLFAILGNLDGLSFLDLFSGSGVVGIEAASRGAEPVVLVEKDRRKRDTLLQNMEIVESTINLQLVSAQHFIRKNRQPFDIIFIDPPFAMANKISHLSTIERSCSLKPDGVLVVHLPKQEAEPSSVGRLYLTDTRTYGGSTLAFYRLARLSP